MAEPNFWYASVGGSNAKGGCLQIDANDLVDDLNLDGITRLGISKFAARDLLKIYTIMPLSVMPPQEISNGVEPRFLADRLPKKQEYTSLGVDQIYSFQAI